MVKLARAVFAVVGLGLILGVSGCSSSNATGSEAQKTAFCNGHIKINKASANVNSPGQLLQMLKANQSELTTMSQNLPGGSLGTEARGWLNEVQTAINSNNVQAVNDISTSAGIDLDTYCGVDGGGNPLPSYFATAKGNAFCSMFAPIEMVVTNTADVNNELQILLAHKAQIDQLASLVAGLPASARTPASNLVSAAQTAIATNSTGAIPPVRAFGMRVSLYCGINT